MQEEKQSRQAIGEHVARKTRQTVALTRRENTKALFTEFYREA